MSKNSLFISIMVFFLSLNMGFSQHKVSDQKPVLFLLGGTPSTKEIIKMVPDSLKGWFEFVSFNRPGFGGTDLSKMSKKKLYHLAKKAGLKKNGFGIIGISGGAPLSILLAEKFQLKHCGVISGMVSNEAYFKHADSTFTKPLFQLVMQSYEEFKQAALDFPNLDAIIQQAGAKDKEDALRACYTELNFLLSEDLFPKTTNQDISIDWWHGEHDHNVSLESAKQFLKDYPNSNLHVIGGVDHNIDANIYIAKLVNHWTGL